MAGVPTPILSIGLHPFPLWWPTVGLPWTSSTQQELALKLEAADLEGESGSRALVRVRSPGQEGPMPLGVLMMGMEQLPSPGSAPHSSPHFISPSVTPPHQRHRSPLSPTAPECFCVKPSYLHCGIKIHEGWMNCTLVNSSSTMIKLYIPTFSGTLMQGWGGRRLDARRGPHETVPLTFSG